MKYKINAGAEVWCCKDEYVGWERYITPHILMYDESELDYHWTNRYEYYEFLMPENDQEYVRLCVQKKSVTLLTRD